MTGLTSIPNLENIRPPLQNLIGAILFNILGTVPDRLPYINIVWISLTAYVVYSIMRRLSDRRVAALGVTFF